MTPPECPYWNFQLNNWWMESLDYEAHPKTTINKATASYMPDGSICLLESPSDPRVTRNRTTSRANEGGNKSEGEREEGDGEGDGLVTLLPPCLLAGVTWIGTAHHAHGTMGLCWVLAWQHPVPRCRVVRLDQALAMAIRENEPYLSTSTCCNR